MSRRCGSSKPTPTSLNGKKKTKTKKRRPGRKGRNKSSAKTIAIPPARGVGRKRLVSTGKRKVSTKSEAVLCPCMRCQFYPDCPQLSSRGGRQDERWKITLNTPHTTYTQTKTPEMCPLPQLSGPNTQTSPDAERGGRQDTLRKNHPQHGPRKTKSGTQ